jgi:hypothetical protein
VKNLYPHLIEATILTGCARKKNVFTPQIPLIPTDLPFDFKRLQFLVRFAFAMSINKAQGRSMKIAGIHLENPCFSHGNYTLHVRGWKTQQIFTFWLQKGKQRTLSIQQHFSDISHRIQHYNFIICLHFLLLVELDIAFIHDAVFFFLHVCVFCVSWILSWVTWRTFYSDTRPQIIQSFWLCKKKILSGIAIGHPGQRLVPQLVI